MFLVSYSHMYAEMDYLSSNPLLPEILSLLRSCDIQSCRKVNWRFHNSINRYSKTLRKPEAQIYINRKNDLLTIECELFLPVELITVALHSDSINFRGMQSRKLLDSFNSSAGLNHAPLFNEKRHWNKDVVSISTENQPQRLRELLVFMFSKIDIYLLSLERHDKGRTNAKWRQLTEIDFNIIADCLGVSKAKVDRLELVRLAGIPRQLMHEREWKCVSVNLGPLCATDMVEIPKNVEEFRLSSEAGNTVPDIAVFQTLIKEWILGKRTFKTLKINGWTLYRSPWYSQEMLTNMLTELPNFTKTVDNGYIINGQIKRSIDEMQLFISIECKYNDFKFSTIPLKCNFMN